MSGSVYRIHPAIGIARVGNSSEYYIGPETEAGLPLPDSKTTGGLPIKPGTESETIKSSDLRDCHGAFKRQAARFRIFQYPREKVESYPSGKGVEICIGSTVNGKKVADIIWTGHVANKKANGYEKDHLGIGAYDGMLPPLRNLAEGLNPSDPERLRKLVIDPGPRTIHRTDAGGVKFDKETTASYWDGTGIRQLSNYPKSFPNENFSQLDCPWGRSIDTLGELETDDHGRLLVVGGYGRACGWYANGHPYPLRHDTNNDGWFDDCSDGPVSAVLVFGDKSVQEVHGTAWTVTTDPSYAPQTLNIVSLWDDVFDSWVRKLQLWPQIYANGEFNDSYRPAFDEQLYPIFRSTELQQWTMNLALKVIGRHDAVGKIKATDNPDKTPLAGLKIIRNPNEDQSRVGAPLMPLTGGDEGKSFLSLSRTQYFFLQQWSNDNFRARSGLKLGHGERLDKAALVNCTGGKLSPGLELTFIVRQPDLYIKDWQTSGTGPFRIKPKLLKYGAVRSGQPFLTVGYIPLQTGNAGLEPGDVSKFMALPWHTDYNGCALHATYPSSPPSGGVDGSPPIRYWAWPAQRPIVVYPAKDNQGPDQSSVQRFSVRGEGTATLNPKTLGRYQNRIDMLTSWHRIGVVVQGSAIDEPGEYGPDFYLEVESQLDDSGNKVYPWPSNKVSLVTDSDS